jgi:glucan biosynthesis protein
VLGSLLVLCASVAPSTADAGAFGLDHVAAQAAKLTASPYQNPGASLPKVVNPLDYDVVAG